MHQRTYPFKKTTKERARKNPLEYIHAIHKKAKAKEKQKSCPLFPTFFLKGLLIFLFYSSLFPESAKEHTNSYILQKTQKETLQEALY
jgi:hypothetical protein